MDSIIPGWQLRQKPIAIAACLKSEGWYTEPGAYVVVDGQFGSTGKGLINSVLGQVAGRMITHFTTNAGPNSGHTAICPRTQEQVMLQQLPMAAVIAKRMDPPTFRGRVVLNAGAILDLDLLHTELDKHDLRDETWVDPFACVITEGDKQEEHFSHSGPARIASTAKGVGVALSRKILRDAEVAKDMVSLATIQRPTWDWNNDIVHVETSQGFSLGINSGFYPHTTSRECTVQQAVADARIPVARVRRVLATFRTYPIRVGNTPSGHSGNWYPDQYETSWNDLGRVPEFTTVTKRVRRVATFSWMQFRECLQVQEPHAIFLNFMNYLSDFEQEDFVKKAYAIYVKTLERNPDFILLGYGPKNSDVKILSYN